MPDERTAAREGRGGAGDEDWEGGDYMDVSQRVAKNRERGEEEGRGEIARNSIYFVVARTTFSGTLAYEK